GDLIGGTHFIISKGNYNEIVIRNFMQQIPAIGQAFQQLITQPDVDPDGYCIEWYVGENDVKCMVRVLT
ncbi:MAG: putative transcription activator, partial [Flavipsychrobacter sp.]|nr:putative transcription activator [Flavipsychrobacter sp.]